MTIHEWTIRGKRYRLCSLDGLHYIEIWTAKGWARIPEMIYQDVLEEMAKLAREAKNEDSRT
jgi:hypothetical protein